MRFIGRDPKKFIYTAIVLIFAALAVWPHGGALDAATINKTAQAYPESAHPYAPNSDLTSYWQSGTGATYLDVTFDPNTFFGAGDKLYVQDSYGADIPGSPFTGASLAGTTQRIPGANVRFRLVSDAAVEGWGYAITNIAVLDIPAPDLWINKSHSGTFAAGQVDATYTINVRNIGSAPTSGPVTVTDLLPAQLQASSISGDGWNCAQPGGPCQRSDALPNRGSYSTITLKVRVVGGGSVVNQATVSGGGDSNTGNNTAEDPTEIESKGPDLRILKSHGGDFTQGQTGATYTILIANIGQGPTNGTTTVTELIPEGLAATSVGGMGWTCAQPSGPCSREDVLVNNQIFPGLTVTVNVAANAPNQLTNVAKVSVLGDTNSNNDTANDLTKVLINGPDVAITKQHTGDLKQGVPGSYTITVNNTGTQATSGTVTVTDTPPQGLNITAMNGSGWTCTAPAGPCSRSDVLPPNASYPVITVFVTPAVAGSVVNTATVNGGNDANISNNVATDPTTITPGNGTCDPLPESGHPYPSNFDFTWTCTVTGNPTPNSVDITFDALTFVEDGADFIYITDANGNNIPGSPFTGTALAGATKNVPGNVVKIRLKSNGANEGYGLKVTNLVGVVSGPADLAITKTHSGNFYQAQVGAQYTITVRNNGTGPTVGQVTVSDVIPAGLAATNISGTGWSCTQPAGPCTRSDSLAPAATYPPLTVTVSVAANAPAAVANTATVAGGGDTNPANNSATDSTTVLVPVANCGVGGLPESGHPYDNNLNQTWTCVQPGNPSSIDVSFDPQTLFEGADFLYIKDKNGNNIPGSPFTGASLAGATKNVPGDTVILTLVSNERRAEWGFKVTNIASVGSVAPDVTLTKTHNGSFSQGQTGATYTILVKNTGGAPTSGQVSVSDNVPAGLTATSIGGTGWTCAQPAGPCTRGDSLFSGGSYPAITLTVNVAANAPSLVTNTATVTGSGDSNAANNNAGDPTTIGTAAGCVLPESSHPYPNDYDNTWVCTVPGNPTSVNVTFDVSTSIEGGDLVYVMNASGVNIAGSPFTGLSLSGQTVNVPGNTVRIRLVSDSRRTDYGFKVTNVTAIP